MLCKPPILPLVLSLVLTGLALAASDAPTASPDAKLDAGNPFQEQGGPAPGTPPHGNTSPEPLPVLRVPRPGWGGYLGGLEERMRRAIARVTYVYEQAPPGGGLDPLGPPGPPSETPPGGGPQADVGVTTDPPLSLYFAPVSPNPSPGGFTLRFDLPRAATVRFSVLDVSGRLVRDVSGRWEAGRHTFDWRAGARPMAPGVYFVRMDVEGKPVGTHRLILLF